MDIIDAIVGEHGVIYALCDHAEREVPRMSALPEVLAAGRMIAAVLRSHLALEDGLLCMPFEAARGHHAVGCEVSHEEIDRVLDQMDEARTVDEAKDHLLAVVGFARRHSAGQEQWIFPEARHALTAAVLGRQGALWAAWRGVRVPGLPDASDAATA